MEFIAEENEEHPGYLIFGARLEDLRDHIGWDLKRLFYEEDYRNHCADLFIEEVSKWSGFEYKDHSVHGFYRGHMWVEAKIDKPRRDISETFGDLGEAALALSDIFEAEAENDENRTD